MNKRNRSKNYKQKQQLAVFSGLGFEIVGMMIGSVVVGKVIDSYLQTKGISVVIMIILSLMVWLYHVIYMWEKMKKDNERVDP